LPLADGRTVSVALMLIVPLESVVEYFGLKA